MCAVLIYLYLSSSTFLVQVVAVSAGERGVAGPVDGGRVAGPIGRGGTAGLVGCGAGEPDGPVNGGGTGGPVDVWTASLVGGGGTGGPVGAGGTGGPVGGGGVACLQSSLPWIASFSAFLASSGLVDHL